ncbi:MAG: LysE family translocator [Candidatus Methanomethylophilaceae archaeon]
MIDIPFWFGFLAAVFLLNVSPGPEMIYVLSATLAGGKRKGVLASLGTATGSTVHVLLVACGLAVILSASLTVFTVVKTAGAVYLIYLGLRTIFPGAGKTTSPDERQDIGGKGQNPYRRGVFVGLLNPKSAIFFLAFLPQFVRKGKGPYALQIVLLGILTVMAGVAIELLLIAVMDKVTDVVKRKQRFMSFIQKATGSLLVGLGIRLALSSQQSN